MLNPLPPVISAVKTCFHAVVNTSKYVVSAIYHVAGRAFKSLHDAWQHRSNLRHRVVRPGPVPNDRIGDHQLSCSFLMGQVGVQSQIFHENLDTNGEITDEAAAAASKLSEAATILLGRHFEILDESQRSQIIAAQQPVNSVIDKKIQSFNEQVLEWSEVELRVQDQVAIQRLKDSVQKFGDQIKDFSDETIQEDLERLTGQLQALLDDAKELPIPDDMVVPFKVKLIPSRLDLDFLEPISILTFGRLKEKIRERIGLQGGALEVVVAGKLPSDDDTLEDDHVMKNQTFQCVVRS